jgi:hypothetical protein
MMQSSSAQVLTGQVIIISPNAMCLTGENTDAINACRYQGPENWNEHETIPVLGPLVTASMYRISGPACGAERGMLKPKQGPKYGCNIALRRAVDQQPLGSEQHC